MLSSDNALRQKAGAFNLMVLVAGVFDLIVFCAATSKLYESDLLTEGTFTSIFYM